MSFPIRPSLMALVAALVSVGAQSAVVGSASSKLENLRVGVIDLNLDDNVAAAVNWQSSHQGLALTPSVVGFVDTPYSGGLQPISPDLLPVAADLTSQALPWSTQSLTSADGANSITLADHSLQVNASLDADQFNAASIHDISSYAYDTGEGSIATTTYDTTRTIVGASNQSRFTPDGTVYDDNIYDFPSAYFELAPHSLLILQGIATTTVDFDSTTLQSQVAEINAQGHSWESGTFLATADIGLGIGLLSTNYEWSDGSIDDQTYWYNYSDFGTNPQVVSMNLQRWGTIDANVTTPASTSRSFSLIVANTSDLVRKGALIVRMEAKVDHTLTSSVTDVTTTFAPIPEPATYALMGLGLVGIALVRRRA